ncbi:DMT family transporter [Paenirhodobacter populi]|uniref:DMT family transporter n=1 Tax=Paenirhodobacter populi TaxID=2306993 RepID=A0A443JV09_9RHOB|nr:DMT family transporter [Sinirhodobacter populi]RWR24350.1 DMT family transporter [Sinirhodobacter populi]
MSRPDTSSATVETVLPGVLLAFASFAAFSFSDACVKLIEGRLPPYESAFIGAVFGLTALPFVMRKGDRVSDIFHTVNRPLWLLRFLAYPIGIIGSVTAFTHLPMAEAFVLIFLQPAFVTVFSVIWLKEPVGIRRWLSVTIGFIGVLIVLRPGFRELTIGHLGAMFAGLAGAISIVTYRAVPEERRLSLIGAGIMGGVIVCGVVSFPAFRWPDGVEWLMLAGYGLLAAFANILLMHAARLAPAALISTTQYSQMLWAILLGWLIWDDTVDMPMFVGMVLIIGSGAMTLMREHVRNVPGPRPMGGATRIAPVTLTRPDEER